MESLKFQSRITLMLYKGLAFLLIMSLGFASYSQEVNQERYDKGKNLFKSQCAACHKLDKKAVGPALGKVEERMKNDWLIKWIRDNAKLRASGDADAIAIYEKFNKMVMPPFPQLTDEQINNILYYTTIGKIKKAKTEKDKVASVDAVSKEVRPQWLIWILFGAILASFFVVSSFLETVNELKGIPKSLSLVGRVALLWEGVKENTFLQIMFVIFGVLTSVYVLFGTLFKVGVDQGYQPIQPIAFSHKIHAGDNKIECQYCHSAAKRSKHSGIPSANVCMNCHKNISEVAEDTKVVLEDGAVVLGSNELNSEIQKIYDAVGWDTEKLVYTGKTKPIKWVRVHDLPDFAYFNHSQHVTVARVKCQKCHGPVEKMEEVYQYSTLTMGWCLDCHKGTNVNLKGNGYYAKIHDELAKKYGIDKVTIAQLGGKECGKCHY